MLNFFLILLGRFISKLSSTFNLGSGSTWPGHIALYLNKDFIKDILSRSKTKTILIAGTNGKTTTGKLIQTILEENRENVFQNQSGANLLNGIASTLIQHSNKAGKINYNFALFEVDENTLPLVINEFIPDYIILLNLFRDQLDRYGEVDTIAKKWKKALEKLPQKTTLILNADDPQIAFLGKKKKNSVYYFGVTKLQSRFGIKPTNRDWRYESTDSNYCPNCNSKLNFKTINFSHLGDWECPSCKLKRPKLDIKNIDYYPLPGIYNWYNSLAAVLFSRVVRISNEKITSGLRKFTPAFGRQETLEIKGKKVKIFLSKNPTSFNESLRTVKELGGKNLLLVLNDRIPDGRDVSWIWDTDIESMIDSFKTITVSGDRCYDMGLRLKYVFNKFQINDKLKNAIEISLQKISKDEALYILPTYTAMLEVRKILTGKKIL